MIKKIAISVFSISAALIFMSSTFKTTGGHPSSTGAPGEETCALSGCHSDAVLNLNSTLSGFDFSEKSFTYQVNRTYDIHIDLTLAEIEKFGFQIVAIDSATQMNAGKWVLSNPQLTQIISGQSPFQSRSYITHTALGTVAKEIGKAKWNFKWTSPSTNVGTILFYYVINATNKDDKSTGEKLFFSNRKIRFSQTGAMLEIAKNQAIKVRFGGGKMAVTSVKETINSLEIYDLNGNKCYEAKDLGLLKEVSLDELKRQTTIYIYKITTDKGTYTGKFFN